MLKMCLETKVGRSEKNKGKKLGTKTEYDLHDDKSDDESGREKRNTT